MRFACSLLTRSTSTDRRQHFSRGQRNLPSADRCRGREEYETNHGLFHRTNHETRSLPEHRKELQDCQNSPPAWILEQKEYLQWQCEDTDKPKWLWAVGQPSVGKSATVAWLGRRLKSLGFPSKDGRHRMPGFAMFFCDHMLKGDIQTTDSEVSLSTTIGAASLLRLC